MTKLTLKKMAEFKKKRVGIDRGNVAFHMLMSGLHVREALEQFHYAMITEDQLGAVLRQAFDQLVTNVATDEEAFDERAKV